MDGRRPTLPAAMTDRRQRQRESREERRREEERRKRIRAAWKRAAIFGGLALLIIGVFYRVQCALGSGAASFPTPIAPSASFRWHAVPRHHPRSPPQSFPDGPEDLGLSPDAPITVTMTTSCGEIVIELDPALAPQGVNSFVFLANEGFYDGTVFHRIIETFVAQGGDPHVRRQWRTRVHAPQRSSARWLRL